MICKHTQCPHVLLLVNCNGHRCFGGYRYMYVKGSESFHPEIIGHVIFCTQFARSILLQILRVYYLWLV